MAATKKDNYDDEDVTAALGRVTSDGPAEDNFDPNELPESDFVSFSEDNVENDHDGDNAGDEEST